MDFVCDIHIARKIVRYLNSLGFEAIHAIDLVPTDGVPDLLLGEKCDELDACIITKDTGFRTHGNADTDNTIPRKIITISDMNSRSKQIIFLLRLHEDKLRKLTSTDESYSYFLDRFGSFSPTTKH